MYQFTEALSELLGVDIMERGVNAMLHCPFHEDDRKSFSVHLDKGIWHCFGCNESGSIERLYSKLGDAIPVSVSLSIAREKAEEPYVDTHDFTPLANSFCREEGSSVVLLKYLISRALPTSVIEQFGLGYNASLNAISMPYIDEDGRVTGIKYRFDNGFKSAEPDSKFGIYNVEHAIGKEKVIVCEGESDTHAVWSRYGDSHGVIGTSGASVSESQWALFSVPLFFASKIYLLHDADRAGDHCAGNALRVLGSHRGTRLRPPDGMDASEFLASGGSLEELGL